MPEQVLYSIMYLHASISKIKIKLKLQLNNVLNTQRLKVKEKDTVHTFGGGSKDKYLKYSLYFKKRMRYFHNDILLV